MAGCRAALRLPSRPTSIGLWAHALLLASFFASGVLAPLEARGNGVACGDEAWERRAEGARDGRAAPGPILEALRCYEAALDVEPENLEARWKLLQALHFAGDFVLQDEDTRRATFERAREVSEEGLELLARQLDSGVRVEEMAPEEVEARLEAVALRRSDVARTYFWAAINWGAWSRVVGLLAAVREGVANRIHRYILVTTWLEPTYHEGGAFRLLGRLHAELPRVPLLTGWVDRDRAIPLVERAHDLASENPGNRLLLALTLLDLAPERRAEALELLQQVAGLTPRADVQIEDFVVREQARKRLLEEAPHLAGQPETKSPET